MNKWAEIKIKTDLKAFENELKRFAKQFAQRHRDAGLVDIYVSEWQKSMFDLHPIDVAGNPVDREEGGNFAIQFTRQIRGKPWLTPSDIEVTFYLSRIGGTYPLLLEIPPGVIDSYEFVRAFLFRCSELWEVDSITSPIKNTAVPTPNDQALSPELRDFLRDLRRKISQRFSKEELRNLSTDLIGDYKYVEYENWEAFVRELTLWCLRHNQLPQLIDRLREERPNEDWDNLPQREI